MALKLLGRTGAVAGRDVAVADLLRIGAGADNDFRVVVGGVSRNHARIVKAEGAYWLEDAGSTNGTFLNGQRVARERLRHLDVVTLGRDVDLIVVTSDRADTAVTRAVSDAWLAPADAAGGPRVDLPVGEMTIGRLAPSNVILESPVVSGLHARVQRTADQVVIQDLGSVNGTFVNGQRIAGATLLKDGDVLSIASIRNFNVHVTGEGGRGQKQEVVASSSAVFDQEWKTKLVWSADELAQLEAERKKIIEAAAQRGPAPAAPKPVARGACPAEAGCASSGGGRAEARDITSGGGRTEANRPSSGEGGACRARGCSSETRGASRGRGTRAGHTGASRSTARGAEARSITGGGGRTEAGGASRGGGRAEADGTSRGGGRAEAGCAPSGEGGACRAEAGCASSGEGGTGLYSDDDHAGGAASVKGRQADRSSRDICTRQGPSHRRSIRDGERARPRPASVAQPRRHRRGRQRRVG